MPRPSPKPKTLQATVDDAAPAAVGSEAAYARFLPEAEKLLRAEVRPLRADVNLAIANAERGAAAVRARRADVARELPAATLTHLERLTDLGSALAYAAGQVERFAPPPSDVKALLSQASRLRALLLGTADVLAVAGILPAAQVAKIHEGHGGIDTAGDCVALAALFTKNAAAVRGKVPFTKADVEAAADVGTRLLAVLRPVSAGKKPRAKELAAASDARDRLWTLFERTWEQGTWRAGAWLFGRAVDEHVPPLQSRVGRKRGAKAATPAKAPGAAS